METLIIFIVALGLAMDCFSLAIVNGSAAGEIKPGVSLQTSLVFVVGHLLMLLLGYWLAGLLSGMFAGMEEWAAFIVFAVIGLKTIREALKRKPEARSFDITNGRVIITLALAASIDALLTGIALGLTGAKLSLALVTVAIAIFLFTFSGLVAGHHFGVDFARRTGIFGGVFLFIAALHYLTGSIF